LSIFLHLYFCGHCFCSWFLVLLFHCPCSCSNSKCWVTMFMILNHTFFPLCACTGKGYSAIKLYANFVFHGLFIDILFWQFWIRTLCISHFSIVCIAAYFLEHFIIIFVLNES
jgi:hypothetical protein